MSEIVVSEKHKKAVALNQKIVTSAELAQQNLWDMCVSLKTMRDDKLYKELGYGNFEDYCENEAGFSRMNAYRYITIAEKINPENVTPVLQIGIKKLSLLATLSGEQQKEVIENVDTDTVTYRELKAEIDKLKSQNTDLSTKLDSTNQEVITIAKQRSELYEQKEKYADRITDLEAEIKELESRPVEVAVMDTSDSERRLNETIKSLEHENIKHYDELEAQYREDTKSLRKKLESEKNAALKEVAEKYEEKLKEAKETQISDEAINFKAAYIATDAALHKLLICCMNYSGSFQAINLLENYIQKYKQTEVNQNEAI